MFQATGPACLVMTFGETRDHSLLQEHTSLYLQQLASGTTLMLSATKPSAKAGADAEIEKITKTVHVRPPPVLPCQCCSVTAASLLQNVEHVAVAQFDNTNTQALQYRLQATLGP